MDRNRKIRVGIIGCGMVADQHAEQLRYLPGCELVAACDTDELMAAQLAERFHIPHIFTDASEMLSVGNIDAVHITTPPQTHFKLAQMSLKAGCHVYVEKPFTINADEANELIELARRCERRITVGHNLQFNPEALRLREYIKQGFLGGPPIHIESIQCYSHDEPTYGRAVLNDPNHWVRRLPGSLLHNLISHGIAKIVQFLDGDLSSILSISFSSPYLIKHGHEDIIDELRVLIKDNKGTTAFFLFTTQFGSPTNELRLYGKEGILILNHIYRTVIRIPPAKHKSYLRYFLGPLAHAKEYANNTFINIRQFLRNEFHMDYGMRKLMELFYNAIKEGGPDPIPMVEIKRTARIMDAIFQQLPRSTSSKF